MSTKADPGDPIPINKADKSRKQSTSVREIRRRRARRMLLRFGIWCGLPTLVAIVYYGFLASPQYQSEATVAIQSNKDGAMGLDGLASVFMPATSTSRDSILMVEYIHSRDMLAKLDKQLGLLAHYKSTSADWWSRLASDADSETAHEYYREHVKASYSAQSGTLSVSVRAYSAEKAREIAKAILVDIDAMVNKLADRAREDRLRVAKQAVAETEKRLAAARKKLLALQGDHTMLDPKATATAIGSIITGLEGQLAQERAKLSSLLSVMQPTAPQVVQQRQLVNGLAGQLAAQKRKLLANDSKGSVKRSYAQFEPAMLEKELAQGAYEAAIKTLELARFEAAKQHRYLVTIQEPSLPTSPTHPRRAWSILTVFVVSLLLMGVGTLLWASIREHANF